MNDLDPEHLSKVRCAGLHSHSHVTVVQMVHHERLVVLFIDCGLLTDPQIVWGCHAPLALEDHPSWALLIPLYSTYLFALLFLLLTVDKLDPSARASI